MPLFRRSHELRPELEFTVGVSDHRVQVGGGASGVTALAEVRGYVGAVTGGAASPAAGGRDSVAVLSAKMDYAELVNDLATVVILAAEELERRGVLDSGLIPPPPVLPPLAQRAEHYDYIQAAHARAQLRMGWLDLADAVLRERGIAILAPRPREEARIQLS